MIVTEATKPEKGFQEIIDSFPNIKETLSKMERLPIKDYFTHKKGPKTIIAELFEKGLLKEKEDAQGLYVFYLENKPFYVGISGKIIQRINQHIKGKNHFSASLSYKIGSDLYVAENGQKHDGGRGKLDLKNLERAQEELQKGAFNFIEVPNGAELYLFEVYMALNLNTYYNSFKTH